MTALLTLAEAADELRLSTDSIRRLVATGYRITPRGHQAAMAEWGHEQR